MKRQFAKTILGFGLMVFGGSFAAAAIRTVDNNSDTGSLSACTAATNDCSLRGAITGAASGDTINFDVNLTNATITLGSEIPIVRNVTVAGLGADKLTISGGGTTRLFSYFGGTLLNINFSGLTLANGNGGSANNTNQGGAMQINGNATTATFDGMVFRNNSASAVGGVLLFAGGACRISNSTFMNNSAGQATVIYFIAGSLEITNSTFSGNSGTYSLIYSFGNPVIVRNSTLVNNPGGGLYKDSGTLTLGNTIVAGNGGYDLSRNSSATINTNGGNLIGSNTSAGPTFSTAGTPNNNLDFVGTNANPIDPLLAPLGNYGGTTPTRALLQNSPAVNNGINCVVNNSCSPLLSAALTADQRGTPRQIGTAVDIGAFEANVTIDPVSLPNGNTSANYNQQLSAIRQTSFADIAEKSLEPQNFAPSNFELVPVAGQSLPTGITLSPSGLLSGMPTVIGVNTFTVKATDTDGVAGVRQYTMQVFGPTAASVSISGRVLTPDGRGLTNATVNLTDPAGNTRTARTSTFGYYRFDEIEAGRTYILTVHSKRYQFMPQVISVTEDIAGLNFTANLVIRSSELRLQP